MKVLFMVKKKYYQLYVQGKKDLELRESNFKPAKYASPGDIAVIMSGSKNILRKTITKIQRNSR